MEYTLTNFKIFKSETDAIKKKFTTKGSYTSWPRALFGNVNNAVNSMLTIAKVIFKINYPIMPGSLQFQLPDITCQFMYDVYEQFMLASNDNPMKIGVLNKHFSNLISIILDTINVEIEQEIEKFQNYSQHYEGDEEIKKFHAFKNIFSNESKLGDKVVNIFKRETIDNKDLIKNMSLSNETYEKIKKNLISYNHHYILSDFYEELHLMSMVTSLNQTNQTKDFNEFLKSFGPFMKYDIDEYNEIKTTIQNIERSNYILEQKNLKLIEKIDDISNSFNISPV